MKLECKNCGYEDYDDDNQILDPYEWLCDACAEEATKPICVDCKKPSNDDLDENGWCEECGAWHESQKRWAANSGLLSLATSIVYGGC